MIQPTYSFLRPLVVCLVLALIVLAPGAGRAQIVNLSSRAECQIGEARLVTEFAVTGSGDMTVVLRALGPSLAKNGVHGVLHDPTLSLFDASGHLLDQNDNWMDNPDKQEIINFGLAPPDARESALIDTLAPGVYTAVVAGVRKTTGDALGEIYNVDSSGEEPLFSGVGVRGFVGSGDDVLISGFIVAGSEPVDVLIRALGPSLTGAGIDGALADPTLNLYDSTGMLVATNDNWVDSPDKGAIIASGLAPEDDLESALIATLGPSLYTVVVSGVNSATGIGWAQIYSLDTPGPELNPVPPISRGKTALEPR